jgi:hypothetical protein
MPPQKGERQAVGQLEHQRIKVADKVVVSVVTLSSTGSNLAFVDPTPD